MRLLVVGGSGFIGRNFLSAFDASSHVVTATYRSDESFPEFIGALEPGIQALRCDLLDESNDFSGYDVALFLGGNSNHTWAQQNPAVDLALNGVSMVRFLQSFRGRLVLVSSAAVYLGHEGLVSPATPVRPLFPYAISKLAAELYAQWSHSVGRLAGCTVLRLYYAYGPGEEERRLIRRALTEFGVRGATQFTINGDGASLLGPLHVSDLVRALELVVRDAKTAGVFDLPGERAYTVNEVVMAAAAECGVDVQIEHRATDEGHVAFYSELGPFAEAFGFQPAMSLRDGMHHYLNHLRHGAAR